MSSLKKLIEKTSSPSKIKNAGLCVDSPTFERMCLVREKFQKRYEIQGRKAFWKILREKFLEGINEAEAMIDNE